MKAYFFQSIDATQQIWWKIFKNSWRSPPPPQKKKILVKKNLPQGNMQ